jgi:enterochelin esterase-like enzyme
VPQNAAMPFLLRTEICTFDAMQLLHVTGLFTEHITINSIHLEREVTVDFFMPTSIIDPAAMSLLLLNDGQNMEEMGFEKILETLLLKNEIGPLFCAAIHTGKERKMEYGVAAQADYLGRGAKAAAYTRFILQELLPYIHTTYAIPSFKEKAFAGFSLGGLSALDMVWAHPDVFTKAGVFSGSFWWRSMDQDDEQYDDDLHRIMQQQIRKGTYHAGQKFFFQTGNLDEKNDRNNNGIIDSIDDTQDVIKELLAKGYDRDKDICYLELPDGKHDIPTWGRAMPEFLTWGWGK